MDPNVYAGRHRDANVAVSITDDELQVIADFFPPLGDGRPLDMDKVEALLTRKGIVYGIDRELIEATLTKMNQEKKRFKDVVIASGKTPVDEVPGFLKLKEHLFKSSKQLDTDTDRIDYKAISPYIIVKKHEVLGTQMEPREGVPGISVKNEEIPPAKKQVEQIKLGTNVKMEDGNLVAVVEGRYVMNKNTVSIVEVLEVDGGVDYSTGNIIFPGDVVINGQVKDGFKVYSGGSVICRDTLDAYDVVSKRDLSAQGGIIGRGKRSVRCGGTVTTKFIENCTVKAKNTISVDDAVLNSRIYTTNDVRMGERGKIIGGETSAVNGIVAYETGNKTGQYTALQCGIDFISQKKFDTAKKKHTALNLKLQTVDSLSSKYRYSNTDGLRKRIKDELNRLVEAMNTLLEKINSNEDVVITVTGTAFPGTTIDICHYHFVVLEPLHRVRFYLDKTVGKVIADTGKKQ